MRCSLLPITPLAEKLGATAIPAEVSTHSAPSFDCSIVWMAFEGSPSAVVKVCVMPFFSRVTPDSVPTQSAPELSSIRLRTWFPVAVESDELIASEPCESAFSCDPQKAISGLQDGMHRVLWQATLSGPGLFRVAPQFNIRIQRSRLRSERTDRHGDKSQQQVQGAAAVPHRIEPPHTEKAPAVQPGIMRCDAA